MEPFTRYLADKDISWAASTPKEIAIPLERWLGEAILRCSVVYDTGASATKAQDGVLNFISKVELKVNGKVVRSWAPARWWYTRPLDLGTKPEFVDVTTTQNNGKTASFVIPLHFRLHPSDIEDMSALLPAKYLSTAVIVVTFGAAGAFGTNQTIVSGTVKTTLREFNLTDADERELYGVSGQNVLRAAKGSRLVQLVETEEFVKPTAAYANLTLGADLPTGAILTRSHLFATLNGVRSDSLISEYAVRDGGSGDGIERIRETWDGSQARDLQEYGFPSPIEGNKYLTGHTVVDYTDFDALDLTDRKQGDAKILFSTAAPVGTTEIALLHEQVADAAY